MASQLQELWRLRPPRFFQYGSKVFAFLTLTQDMSNDIVRFMDENKITMATIGGHGFGAKVATATAINHMNRFTGVMCLDGGPLDHRYYEAYQELASYIE